MAGDQSVLFGEGRNHPSRPTIREIIVRFHAIRRSHSKQRAVTVLSVMIFKGQEVASLHRHFSRTVLNGTVRHDGGGDGGGVRNATRQA